MRGLIVGEDLVEAQDDVGEEKRAFYWISFPATYTPSTKEDRTCNGNANQSSIDVADVWEPSNSPEEVD